MRAGGKRQARAVAFAPIPGAHLSSLIKAAGLVDHQFLLSDSLVISGGIGDENSEATGIGRSAGAACVVPALREQTDANRPERQYARQ
jgi:hypothetical protein